MFELTIICVVALVALVFIFALAMLSWRKQTPASTQQPPRPADPDRPNPVMWRTYSTSTEQPDREELAEEAHKVDVMAFMTVVVPDNKPVEVWVSPYLSALMKTANCKPYVLRCKDAEELMVLNGMRPIDIDYVDSIKGDKHVEEHNG